MIHFNSELRYLAGLSDFNAIVKSCSEESCWPKSRYMPFLNNVMLFIDETIQSILVAVLESSTLCDISTPKRRMRLEYCLVLEVTARQRVTIVSKLLEELA